MNQNINIDQIKQDTLLLIESINAVDGFDPRALAVEYVNLSDGSTQHRLPVIAQIAWFRLKYPDGKISVTVKPGKDHFVSEARVYADYRDSAEQYLAEGSASRGYIPEKPTVSPREWSQTAAIGIALRNAGFGLQFPFAGENFEDNTLNEFLSTNARDASAVSMVSDVAAEPEPIPQENDSKTDNRASSAPCIHPETQPQYQPEPDPLEKAMAVKCPIAKYKDKTLGDLVRIDPNALSYIARSGVKYGEETAGSAKLICENAVQQASA